MTHASLRFRAAHGAAAVLWVLGFAGLASSCATSLAQTSARREAPSTPGLDESWLAVEREIGDARCDVDSQCRTVPVGNKPCGGPERWLAWSAMVTNESDLHRRIDQYSLAQARLQRASGLMSNCAIVPDPGATCRAGHCVPQAPGSLR